MSSRAFRRITECTNEDLSVTSGEPVENECRKTYFSPLDFTVDYEVETSSNLDEGSTSKTKSRKKKRSKKKNVANSDERSVTVSDELVLSQNDDSATCPLSDLLVVQSKTLDWSSEICRLFKSNATKRAPKRHGSSQTKRGLLVPIKNTWPLVTKLGLDMIRSSDGAFFIAVGKSYKKYQLAFYETLGSMADLNGFSQILNQCPYHIDSLLQLSEGLMHQDQSELGIDLLERVLHAYQTVFHPLFNPTAGSCQLDYRHQINRGLFVSLFRYASLIGSRGCYRCALDYFKILFSLDVSGDPLAVLLVIDHFALLSGELEFLLKLYEKLNPTRNLHLLPNFAFSVALATYWKSDSSDEADLLLQDALIMFPGFLTRLMNHTRIGGVSNLNKSILFGTEVQNEPPSLGRLLDLYVARSHLLWTSAEVISWLESNVAVVLSLIESREVDARLSVYSERRKSLYPDLPRNVLRHLVLAEIPEAPPIIPQSLASTAIYHFDPLPPEDSIDICKPESVRQVTQNASRGIFSSFFLSLLPGYSPEDVNQQDAGVNAVTSTVRQAITSAAELLSQLRHALDLRAVEQQEHDDQNRPE